jgi:hypothetical protein
MGLGYENGGGGADTTRNRYFDRGLSNPNTGDTIIILGYTDETLTAINFRAVLPNGSSTPSVSYKIYVGTLGAGTALVTAGNTVTNTTTGTQVLAAAMDVTAIPVGYIYAEVNVVSGTVPWIDWHLAAS